MAKIVYHGTFSDQAPHSYDQDTFHAGSQKSAHDRLEEAQEVGGIATVHAYEISDNAPMSKKKWADPLEWRNSDYPEVPEDDTTKIYPYDNAVEDKGSTSYVIPRRFVGRHVTHLGPQFQEPRGEGGKAIMSAISVMSGGRYK
jgi:hypothetical protein